jgi:hypothetical protein
VGTFNAIYGAHISWSSPTTPVPKEIQPALAFDRLFAHGQRRTDRSVLDAVREDARRLTGQLSGHDQQKLDEYLTSIREVEKRIVQADPGRPVSGWKPTLTQPTMKRPAEGMPGDVGEQMRLLLDIMVLAFQMDRTRICTLMFNNDQSGMTFPQIGVHIGQHGLSHSGGEAFQKVNQFHVQQLAYAAGRMKAISEGERSLLDNSMVLFCSSLWTGSTHDRSQVPVLLLGRGGGSLKTGRTLDYLKAPNRLMCSLYLCLMDRMGLELPRFGDSDQRLAGL